MFGFYQGLVFLATNIFRKMTPERTERLESVLNKRQPGLTVVLENVFGFTGGSANDRAISRGATCFPLRLCPNHTVWTHDDLVRATSITRVQIVIPIQTLRLVEREEDVFMNVRMLAFSCVIRIVLIAALHAASSTADGS